MGELRNTGFEVENRTTTIFTKKRIRRKLKNFGLIG